ncbi:uncharacterized protein TRAVEDRAFT_30811 [Trametes versicolor FP-101664 SS1]|uniref:uncharacterized protein n=1 Tax=Trametes versicolor (strain FP-101664) TaxID=717944 RepID=UPI0004621DB2|nr:uncharacterized protein TRAVEDRAFT_30811 [Trametes versicolor FP-101664 SS1]EIW54788.1 hypothetical protein TRAVEDRAFT_30811 [Trametes versicolor FP-101664 SS1]
MASGPGFCCGFCRPEPGPRYGPALSRLPTIPNSASQMSSSVGDPDDPRSMKHKFHCVFVHDAGRGCAQYITVEERRVFFLTPCRGIHEIEFKYRSSYAVRANSMHSESPGRRPLR